MRIKDYSLTIKVKSKSLGFNIEGLRLKDIG